ncbi:hypothetical protein [Rhizobium laguerreae]|uniref:Uncharacterized protein n=1 Tax=Rhizobium laguerreae TaxID=1076926 RepID=A0A7Y2RB97_9HYPH|nr:hypothetical protein [Rhizobium laguerreae]NNH67809.1 hypothetical protein [Rhizobium laguerreae]
MTNLPATLSTLKQEIGALTDKLAAARPDFIAECIDKLKAGGMMVPKTIAAAEFVREYTMALGGVPSYGLAVAVAKLKRGEYPDVKPDFMPLPAMLAAIARLETKTIRDDLARLREKEATLAEVAKPREKTSEEQKERIRQLHAQFKAAHAESKVGERFNPVPADMTPEQLEYWAQIQAIRDAPSITEEQHALRRKIASSMASAAQDDKQEAAE